MEKGQPFYTMQVVEGKPNSETEIQLLQHDQQWGKYELKPHTGKQHQLRVHLSHSGIPIQNDPFILRFPIRRMMIFLHHYSYWPNTFSLRTQLPKADAI